MKTWYFTFGVGSPLANYFVRIKAADEEAARLQMVVWFTRHWASCYDKRGWGEDGETQAEVYGLTELRVPKNASVRLKTNEDELSIEMSDIVYHSGRVLRNTTR
jgi:hypothetical protein